MEEKRRQPKKIRMPPLVDRYEVEDTLVFYGDSVVPTQETHENNHENNSQSIQQLESESSN